MSGEIFEEGCIRFADTLPWDSAIRTAAEPLLASGAIRPSYVDSVIDRIGQPGGTYMDLGFGVTLAHSRPEAGVERTGVSLLMLGEPAELADDPRHPMKAVIFLAAADTSSHQRTMAQIAKLLINEDRRTRLLSSVSVEEVRNAINEKNVGQE